MAVSMRDLLGGFKGAYLKGDLGSSDFTGGEFEVYYALSRLLEPQSVLEVGVYCGYSAASIVAGGNRTLKAYFGIDAELYRRNSNEEALRIVQQMQDYQESNIAIKILKLNTQTDSFCSVDSEMFDWVHIDAGHTKQEAIRDITQFWPVTRKVMTVHDVDSHPPVKEAVEHVQRNNLLKGCCASLHVKSIHGFHLFMR